MLLQLFNKICISSSCR